MRKYVYQLKEELNITHEFYETKIFIKNYFCQLTISPLGSRYDRNIDQLCNALKNFLKRKFIEEVGKLLEEEYPGYYQLNIDIRKSVIRITFKILPKVPLIDNIENELNLNINTYFDSLPVELQILIQKYIPDESVGAYTIIINKYNDKLYWKYFYSTITSDFKLIIDNKPDIIYYIEHFYKLANFKFSYHKDHFDLDTIVYYLSRNNENVDAIQIEKILLFAIDHGNFEMAKYLIDNNADVSCRVDYYEPPIFSAVVLSGNFDVVKYLLEHKTDINLPYLKDKLILFHAMGNLEITKLLLEYGVDINHGRGYSDENILGTAILFASPEYIKFILENRASVSYDVDRSAPLDLILERYRDSTPEQKEEIIEIIQLMISLGATTNEMNLEDFPELKTLEKI